MNKQRRKDISDIADRVQQIAADIDSLKSDLEDIKSEEQDAFDNLPESLQESERAVDMQVAIGLLEDALSGLEDFDGDTIVSQLEQAQD